MSAASSGNKKDMAAWITIISALAGILAGGVVTYATSFMQTSETYMIGWRAPLYQQCDSALSVTCHANRDNSGTRRSPGASMRPLLPVLLVRADGNGCDVPSDRFPVPSARPEQLIAGQDPELRMYQMGRRPHRSR
jgi:hypothetical protein